MIKQKKRMKKRKFPKSLKLATVVLVATFAVICYFEPNFPIDFKNALSSVFFTESTSTEYLKGLYNSSNKKIRILVVPGHDSKIEGATFKGIRESEMDALIGEQLTRFLRDNQKYEVIMTRNSEVYNETITNFISANKPRIKDFINSKKKLMDSFVGVGAVNTVSGVYHNAVSNDRLYQLYGFNLWANDNKIDLVVNVHLNDYPRKSTRYPGEYDGLSVYVPEKQFSNAKASRAIAQDILDKLTRFYPKSNMPKEKAGVVEDQTLISLGAFNTLNGAAVLVEYGYIYEPQFTNAETRAGVIKDLAYQTYLGITNFFDPQKALAVEKTNGKSALLPYSWNKSLTFGMDGLDIFSLQAALVIEGFYPPSSLTQNDCPMTGKFKDCTSLAIKSFQQKYGISQTGSVGPQTLLKINELYSVSAK